MRLTMSAPNNYARSDQKKAATLAAEFMAPIIDSSEWIPPTDERLKQVDESVHPDLYPLVRFYIYRDWT